MSSPALAFVTLFLSLVVGPQPVEVRVGHEVERVEIEVDGTRVATLERPRWSTTVDFGDRLQPRHLEAIAFDAAGDELARAVQWVNLPTPGAEVEVLLSPEEEGRMVASLTWANVTGVAPESIRLSFDGTPVEVDDPRRIVLPPHDLEQLHFLRVEIEFPDNLSAVEEVTYGGSYGEELNTELTAIPIQIEPGRELPDASRLSDWFSVDGAAVRIAAIDEGPAEVIIIRDAAVQTRLERLVGRRMSPGILSPYTDRFDGRLRKDQNLGFFWPFLVQSPSGRWTLRPPTAGCLPATEASAGSSPVCRHRRHRRSARC